jgi:hypothetical protein
MSKKNQKQNNKKNKKEFEYEEVEEIKEQSKSTPWSGFGNLDSQALSRFEFKKLFIP